MKLRNDYKETRRKEAQERQEAYDKLSPKEKIAILDKRLGKGLGAKKQRAKLQAQMEANKEKRTK